MRGAYVIHIVCGSLGLLSGFVALYTAKGGGVHRKSGRLFVYVMLVMALAGLTLAVVLGTAPELNVPAAVLTSYLVVTALTTVRPPAAGARLLHLAAMVVGLIVGLTALTLGFEAVANGGKRNGLPAFPFFMFGVVGLLGAIGDLRVWRQGARRGTARLARHLWRMSFALFIAALSFFIGQAKVIPKPIRIYPLLALPVLAVLVTMVYWLWRVRIRGSLRGIVGGSAAKPAKAVG